MKKGFSLTEILVSIAIIGILSGIGIQAFVASRQRARLEEDVAKVVQALRKAQNSALAPSTAGIRAYNNICSIVLYIDKDYKTINTYYRVLNNGTCSSGYSNRKYGPSFKLDYSKVSYNIIFEFKIPDASTLKKSVTLSLDGISKTITVTGSGLIKVTNN